MNEVLAPFIWLKSHSTDEHRVINCFSLFVNLYMPTFFIDKEFNSVQCCMQMLNLLLRFHSPKLANHLEEHDIIPEMYAYNWLITYLVNKKEPMFSMYLWNKFIKEGD